MEPESAGGGFEHAFEAKPSDELLPHVTGALYVGNGGALSVEMAGGELVTLRGIPTGALLPIAVRRILGETSASGIVGLY